MSKKALKDNPDGNFITSHLLTTAGEGTGARN